MKNKKLLYGIVAVCVLAVVVDGLLIYWAGKSDKEEAGMEAKEAIASVEKGVEPIARNFVDLLSKEEFDEAYKLFNKVTAKAMPAEKLEETWNSLIGQVGQFKGIVKTRAAEEMSWKVIYVTCNFAKSSLDIKVVFDEEAMISGLWFVPTKSEVTYSSPEYGKPESFRETECVVGSGEWELPGSLAVPKGEGTFPAVVLVHGSGPNDRDETIGPNKPFKDLAWGLVTKGIAVLRYEKRTKQYSSKIVSVLKDFTIEEETINDALAAVNLLRETEGIDPDRIFILGHSFGGMLVPRIAAGNEEVAGLILLAANTRNLLDMILSQTEYIFSLDGKIDEAEAEQLKEIEEEVKKVKELNISEDEIVLGAARTYWADLMAYNHVETASELNIPMLILQGERDYQVTMEDFQGWKEGLAGREKVHFKVYPQLNHLFISGSGKSTPAEYNKPGNVAQIVIEDIAEWIKSQ